MAVGGMDRHTVRLLEGLGMRLWGFPPRLMFLVVDHLGSVGAVAWFVVNMPRYQRSLRVLGPLRTHLACLTVSLHNGCRYCAFGHAYALELIHLRDRDVLFPVDAGTLADWRHLAPSELRDRLRDVLQQAGLHLEVLWVDRTLALATGAHRPVDEDEARLAHLVRMFGLLNAIGVGREGEPDQAHDPLNGDTDLKARHAALRATAA
jgi:alkylhydroperoxidase family enzyme